MKVISSGIVDGVILDQYGKRGTIFTQDGYPAYSLPFEVIDAPEGTKSFAIMLEDKDAVPVTQGFSWIHWVACNIKTNKVEKNASLNQPDFIQGLNSWTSAQGGNVPREKACGYGGMGAPDRPHIYELHVYALDTELPLKHGFWMNEMYRAMEGHILESFTLKGRYDN